MGTGEVEKLFRLIVKLQAVVKDLLEQSLLSQVPYPEEMVQRSRSSDKALGTNFSLEQIHYAIAWAKEKLGRVEDLGFCMAGFDPELGFVSETSPVIIYQQAERLLVVPHKEAKMCSSIRKQICGEPLVPYMFLKMIADCTVFPRIRDAETGEATGFTACMADLGTVLSVEEGKAANAELFDKVKREVNGAT